MSNHVSPLCISGNFRIVEVTERLEMQPSSFVEIGEVCDFDSRLLPAPVSTWDFDAPDDISVHDKLRFLREKLSTKSQAITGIASMYQARITPALEPNEILTLNPALINEVSTLGVGIECYYPEPDGGNDAH